MRYAPHEIGADIQVTLPVAAFASRSFSVEQAR
jgi:hypothetical protein